MVVDFLDAWQLAQRRKSGALTQNEVAALMGVTKARVSQIERGEVSSVDVVARYVEAIGGRLELTVLPSFPTTGLALLHCWTRLVTRPSREPSWPGLPA
ncbi:helix-turn-helix domain-containing protein [Nonomuraea glycinis]|uniref:helix-turn-helix domain-containing protein n=1 Tax=Nonomuraea glycinis TaxID=2047744 RepID=UPI0033A5C4AA